MLGPGSPACWRTLPAGMTNKGVRGCAPPRQKLTFVTMRLHQTGVTVGRIGA